VGKKKLISLGFVCGSLLLIAALILSLLSIGSSLLAIILVLISLGLVTVTVATAMVIVMKETHKQSSAPLDPNSGAMLDVLLALFMGLP
jgi:hypothetical protein